MERFYLKILTAFTVLLLVFMLSCGEGFDFFEPVLEDGQVEFSGVEPGTAFIRGDVFIRDFQFEFDDTLLYPDEAIVSIYDIQGNLLEQFSYSESSGFFTIPENLESGVYTLTADLLEEESVLYSESIMFFILDEEYRIQELQILPSVIYPAGQALVFAELDIPSGSDPFLRWSIDDTDLQFLRLSEGGGRLYWNAPEREGGYLLKVELFPFYSESIMDNLNESDISFQSSIQMETTLYVSPVQPAEHFDLVDDGNYYALYHFKGESVDHGDFLDSGDLANIGVPVLDVYQDISGFQLQPGSGFESETSLLPLYEDGTPAPFSVNMRLLLEGYIPQEASEELDVPLNPSVLFENRSEDGSYRFKIQQIGNKLVSTFSLGEVSYVSTMSLEPFYDSSGRVLVLDGDLLTFSCIPGEDLICSWFLNGEQKGNVEYFSGYEPVKIPSEGGTAVIGGEDGFYGILDEFGIFFKSSMGDHSIDIEIYEREMELRYGEDLIFAEGFDSAHFLNQYQSDNRKGLLIKDSSMIISSGSLLEIPVFIMQDYLTDFSLFFNYQGTLQNLEYISTENHNNLYLNFTARDLSDSENQDQMSVISFMKTEHGFQLFQDYQSMDLDVESIDNFVLSIENTDKEEFLELREIMIFREDFSDKIEESREQISAE